MYLQVQLSLNTIIIYIRIDLAILQVKHKKYFWSKPECCPCCEIKNLWGHGFVYRYFAGYPEALPLKRLRCPHCGAVHTMRPKAFFEGFSTPIVDQYTSIKRKLKNEIWLKSYSRQIQQYWYQGFRKQIGRVGLDQEPMEFLDKSRISGFPFISHSLKYDVNSSFSDSPHLIFAATDPQIPP